MLENTFSINMVALSNGQPQLMNLKGMLDAFLAHRRDVVTKRTIYELNRSINRAHILEGQTIALTNIDEMIAIIKKSKTPSDPRVNERTADRSCSSTRFWNHSCKVTSR